MSEYVKTYNVKIAEDLRIVLYELTIKDPINNIEYDVALVATRRGLTSHVTRTESAKGEK